MKALDKKLWRDLMKLKMQAVAISLVLACGVATLVLAVGAWRSLDETRSAFYERYNFGTVFASATRAPLNLLDSINRTTGIASSEARIYHPVILDIVGMAEPGTGLAVSIPDSGQPRVNQLYIRAGRLPDVSRSNEVAVVEPFASEHGFTLGDRFNSIMNGHKRELVIVGIVMSPEFIYAIGPGDMVPDQRRFGVFFMPQTALAGIFEMEGAFNNISLLTMRGTDLERAIDKLDELLKPYGGTGAYSRRDQVSNAFLDNELKQLKGTVTVVPPIFLIIAAFLVNMILSRLIALEQEQIGLLKAIGYSDLRVAWHYSKLVIVIAGVGIVIGSIVGTWMGYSLTKLYAQFFNFPFLIFKQTIDLYFIAGLVAIVSSLAGAATAIWRSTKLSPAVAMRAPAPVRYRLLVPGEAILLKYFSQLSVMALRHIFRWPMRSLLTTLGTSMSVAILIASLFSYDSIDFMIDTVFFRSNRQNATVLFTRDLATSTLSRVASMPGVLRAEPFRYTTVTLNNGHHEKRVRLAGISNKADLVRVLDRDLNPVPMPAAGLMLSERLARILNVRIGDLLEVELLEKSDQRVVLAVTGIINSFVGLAAYMDINALDRLMMNGRRLSGADVLLDDLEITELYKAVKDTPDIAGIALLGLSLKRFRETIEQNITMMTAVYISLAIIITFGVIYNSARIQLSERARELASLRVFGFTKQEVLRVLLIELGVIIMIAQPLGWLIGYGIAYSVAKGFESDLFSIPLIVSVSTYAKASLIVVISAVVSALIVARRVGRLDLVRVLKTRE